MNYSKSLSIIFLSFLLASCASAPVKRPEGWPDIVRRGDGDGCIDLSGLYVNKAIEAPDNHERTFHESNQRWAVYLSGLLIPYIPTREFVEHRWADTVELRSVENENLEVVMWRGDKAIYRAALHEEEEDFMCSADSLIVRSRYSPDNMMGISEVFITIELHRGSDGSILADSRENELGTIIVVPYWGKKVQSYLFLPAASE